MSVFDRMKTTWFPPTAVATRPGREPKMPPAYKPTVDEDTARAAAQILENRAFERVMTRLEAECHAKFAASANVLELPALQAEVQALGNIRAQIQAMADELKFHKHNPENVFDN